MYCTLPRSPTMGNSSTPLAAPFQTGKPEPVVCTDVKSIYMCALLTYMEYDINCMVKEKEQEMYD